MAKSGSNRQFQCYNFSIHFSNLAITLCSIDLTSWHFHRIALAGWQTTLLVITLFFYSQIIEKLNKSSRALLLTMVLQNKIATSMFKIPALGFSVIHSKQCKVVTVRYENSTRFLMYQKLFTGYMKKVSVFIDFQLK